MTKWIINGEKKKMSVEFQNVHVTIPPFGGFFISEMCVTQSQT